MQPDLPAGGVGDTGAVPPVDEAPGNEIGLARAFSPDPVPQDRAQVATRPS